MAVAVVVADAVVNMMQQYSILFPNRTGRYCNFFTMNLIFNIFGWLAHESEASEIEIGTDIQVAKSNIILLKALFVGAKHTIEIQATAQISFTYTDLWF